MKYNPNVEYVVDQWDTHNTVSPRKKKDLHDKLYHVMEEYSTHVDDRIRFDLGIEKMLVVSPILLNVIANREPENVLFVGHHDQGKNRNWNRDNLNILSQLIPIVHRVYGFSFEMTLLKPSSPKNLGTIWHLYNQFELSSMQFNKQYVHGEKVLIKDVENQPDEKFDTVIFAGVPHTSRFSGVTLQKVWERWCKPHFELVDIYDGGETQDRFIDQEHRQDIERDVSRAFTLRSEHDREESEWKQDLYEKVIDSVTVY